MPIAVLGGVTPPLIEALGNTYGQSDRIPKSCLIQITTGKSRFQTSIILALSVIGNICSPYAMPCPWKTHNFFLSEAKTTPQIRFAWSSVMRRCQCNELLLVSGYCDVCPFCDTPIKPVTIISILLPSMYRYPFYIIVTLKYIIWTLIIWILMKKLLRKDSMNLNLIFQVLLIERNFELLIWRESSLIILRTCFSFYFIEPRRRIMKNI